MYQDDGKLQAQYFLTQDFQPHTNNIIWINVYEIYRHISIFTRDTFQRWFYMRSWTDKYMCVYPLTNYVLCFSLFTAFISSRRHECMENDKKKTALCEMLQTEADHDYHMWVRCWEAEYRCIMGNFSEKIWECIVENVTQIRKNHEYWFCEYGVMTVWSLWTSGLVGALPFSFINLLQFFFAKERNM